ncbi:MAG: sialidase family protein [Myxococcales bacterium]
MKKIALAVALISWPALAVADSKNPTWWDKLQFLAHNPPDAFQSSAKSPAPNAFGGNVDVSNECGPQSETFIAINPRSPANLAAGSNEIFRLPMRGYFSTDSGAHWGGVDLPLPPPIGTNGIDFGSDPTLAFDSSGNVFYGYIVVFFSAGVGNGAINGTEMAVARSSDGGRTYPTVTFFAFNGGSNHFNDKPMITADANLASPFRDNVYIGWDAASGGSAVGGGVHVARSTDHGATFTLARVDDPHGPGRSIGATVTVGPGGEVYAAWNDFAANAIVFNRSFDGGATWGTPTTLAPKQLPFDLGIPAEFNRGALVYPACDADRSTGAHRGRVTCSWMDFASGLTTHTDIFTSVSDDKGATWSLARSVGDTHGGADRFNHWLATDPVTGTVNVSYYDTRNDTTGAGFQTDVFLQRGDGQTFGLGTRVTTALSNEHDCNGLFPCASINYGNQQGDYEGLAAFGGIAHPVWTDSRRNQENATPTCAGGRGLMEEVFTATVK